jgi:hypothetical protein
MSSPTRTPSNVQKLPGSWPIERLLQETCLAALGRPATNAERQRSARSGQWVRRECPYWLIELIIATSDRKTARALERNILQPFLMCIAKTPK